MMHVFIEAQDAHYVWPARDAPVQLHLAARFWAVVENLQNTERGGKRSGGKIRCINAEGWNSFGPEKSHTLRKLSSQDECKRY